ncbi:MAG: helix-turn-helix transcriptional regulator [Clostridia bacterium]|nr:helix-turn-helix transcriptional regulator [Clostridia bacterium]
MKNIGQRIKALRKKNSLTQERLADYLGVTDKAVSKWECGLTLPDLALIVPLARILHVSADELLSGKPEEIDMHRAEFDQYCDHWLEYKREDNYQMALQATSEYPRRL